MKALFAREKFSEVSGAFSKPMETSLPYSVIVENSNLADTAATLFNSATARVTANFGNPAGITLTSGTAGVTYRQLLAQIESVNFKCGKIYAQAISGPNSSITSLISVTYKDANGEQKIIPIKPQLDPMQSQSGVLELETEIYINALSSLVFTVPAAGAVSTSLQFWFYPVAKVDPGLILEGKSPHSEFRIITTYGNEMFTTKPNNPIG